MRTHRNPKCTRRTVLTAVGAAGWALTPAACARPQEPPAEQLDAARRGRLRFQPTAPESSGGRTGRLQLPGGEGAPAAELLVPPGQEPLRLVLVLHGAGGAATRTISLLAPYAVEHRLLLLAVQSVRSTWDVITGGYGPDVRNIDSLLQRVAAQYPIKGYTVSGFSDGASYALSLGLNNGDVFDSVVAFSPGFEASASRRGRPGFFVSHGTGDKVLPIERCSRRLVPKLQDDGYEVTYVEFPGGHSVPPEISRRAVDWLSTQAEP
jgi:predicted esterase